MRTDRLLPALLILLLAQGNAWAMTVGRGLPAATLCRAAIQMVERGSGVPTRLMAAIARVESGRRDPDSNEWRPWPWTINAEGQGFFYESKAEAIAAVRALQAKGVRSIDVGCMQVNLMHHPDAFASLDAAFDPAMNATYAAKFLNQLHDQTRDWDRATGMYHSGTPELAAEYLRRVLAVWPDEKRRGAAPTVWAMAEPAAEPGGRVAVSLPVNRLENIRIVPAAPFANVGSASAGRGLDAYRASPIAIASPFRIGG